MRLKQLSSVFLLALSLCVVSVVGAQSPSVEWTAWNAQITAHASGAPLDISETQIIKVTDGTLHSGERDYSQQVNIQSVYLAVNGGQAQQLQTGSGANTYQVTQTSSDVLLDYQLPAAANAGDSFVVQINYTVNPPASGLIDWFIVPGSHGATVDSSKVTINFPDGDAPDTSFVRVPQGNASVTASGNSIVVQSQGALAANEGFEIQVPYGAGVGAVDNSNSGTVNTSPVQNVPSGTSNDTSGGLGSLLPVLCVVGLLVLVGGGGLLRNLLGGILGGGNSGGGGIFGGGNSSGGGIFGGGNSSGGTSSGRGFRQSSNQNREVPTIDNDKRSGGGASFK
ncbi:MAG: hypothetical protein ABI700_13430 [Chloroflexota bacterium]